MRRLGAEAKAREALAMMQKHQPHIAKELARELHIYLNAKKKYRNNVVRLMLHTERLHMAVFRCEMQSLEELAEKFGVDIGALN